MYAGTAIPSPNVQLNIRPVRFGNDNVTVIVEWTKEDHVSYHVEVVPQVLEGYYDEDATVQMVQVTVDYNIHYNVRVLATICGESSIDVIEIYYGQTPTNTRHRQCIIKVKATMLS